MSAASTEKPWGPTHLEDGTPYGQLHQVNCKEQFSLAYAHAVVTAARCKVSELKVDDERVDFTVRQVANHDVFDGAAFDVQMKCTSQDVLRDDGVHWTLDTNHYDDLRSPRVYTPKILVVLVVPDDLDEWFEHSTDNTVLRKAAYWVSLRGAPPATGATKTVTLPAANHFNVPGVLGILSRVGNGGLP